MTIAARLAFHQLTHTLRGPTALALAAYTVLAVLALPVIAELSLGAADRSVVDLGLLGARATSAVTALVVGLSCIGPIVRSGEAATWLAWPVRRAVWVGARFVGSAAAAQVTLLVATLIWCGVATALNVAIPSNLPVYLLAGSAETLVLTAMGLFAGTALRTPVATLATLVAVILGHLGGMYADIHSPNSTLTIAGQAVRLIVPQLERFNLQAELVHSLPIPAWTMVSHTAHALAWTLAFILGTTLVLHRRDL